MLSFKTVNFGPLACIQDKHINMPFQSWELRPIGVDHARFTIIAAILEAEIEIKVCEMFCKWIFCAYTIMHFDPGWIYHREPPLFLCLTLVLLRGVATTPLTVFALVLKIAQPRGKIAPGTFKFILSLHFSEKILNLPPTPGVG